MMLVQELLDERVSGLEGLSSKHQWHRGFRVWTRKAFPPSSWSGSAYSHLNIRPLGAFGKLWARVPGVRVLGGCSGLESANWGGVPPALALLESQAEAPKPT